ncbi:transmembrane protein with metallophosphoesterase domain-like [Mytilus galloprovincialis]|uniref:transmembrane protein with metallophosphoesterase domain-like n=1 Tax=Mytilus galloprovincialis TaxID=29158 RepID=UPI003F7C8BEC
MIMKRKGALIVSIVAIVLSVIFAESWVLSLESKLRGRILRIQVVIIIQCGVAVISIFLWKNLSTVFQTKGHDTSPPRLFWKFILILYTMFAHGSYLSNVFLVRTEPSVLAIVSYLCLGAHVQMFTFLVIAKAVGFIIKLCKKRPLKNNSTAIMAMFYGFLMTSYGYYRICQPPMVKNVTIPIKKLPPSLNGFTITLLSDIHIGPTVGKKQLEVAVDITNSLQSDVVVIDGDLVDGVVSKLKDAVQPLRDIKSKYGIFYVTGNHEYYTMDVENWMETLKELGVHVLHNANARVPADKADDNSLCFVGTDDIEADRIRYDGHGMKLDTAIKGCSTEQITILLAHQPSAAKIALQSNNKIDLILCGHTHGGQMFPIIIGAYFINPFYAGLYQHGDSFIYVTMGTYYWGFPMRIGTQHEITKITLVSV